MQTRDLMPAKRYSMLLLALLFIAGTLWRGFVAIAHYRRALGIHDDPSARELEQVSALFEGGIALILAVHALLLWRLARRGFEFHWRLAFGIALLYGLALFAALSGAPVPGIVVLYPVVVATGSALLSRSLPFSWPSLYSGAVAGGVPGCYAALPTADATVCLFAIAPGIVWVLLGAGLGRLLARKARRVGDT